MKDYASTAELIFQAEDPSLLRAPMLKDYLKKDHEKQNRNMGEAETLSRHRIETQRLGGAPYRHYASSTGSSPVTLFHLSHCLFLWRKSTRAWA